MKIKYLIIGIIGIIQISLVHGQDTLRISALDLLSKINSENLQIKIAEQDYESARADYKQSRALFLPNISASHTAMVTNNPLMAFGSKLNQAILTQADFNPTLLNNPDRTTNFATKIEILQPLINLDGLYERKAANAKMEAYQLQFGRTKEYLELEVYKSYMQLQLAYSALNTLQKAKATAQANKKMVNDYFDQGLLQKSDLLDMQVRFNEVENQWQMAQSQVQNMSDYLSFLMNETERKIYIPSENISTEIEQIDFAVLVPEIRKDIQAMNKSTEAHEKMYRSGKMNLLPKLNAFGNYQMYDNQLFGMNAKGYLLGAQLSWTLFDGYQSYGTIEKNRLEYEKAATESNQYRAKSQMELNQSLRQLKDARNKVWNSKLALEQSSESYNIRKDRFAQGLVKTTDLLQSETQQLSKELEYLQSLFEYHFTEKYIEFLTK